MKIFEIVRELPKYDTQITKWANAVGKNGAGQHCVSIHLCKKLSAKCTKTKCTCSQDLDRETLYILLGPGRCPQHPLLYFSRQANEIFVQTFVFHQPLGRERPSNTDLSKSDFVEILVTVIVDMLQNILVSENKLYFQCGFSHKQDVFQLFFDNMKKLISLRTYLNI